MDDWGGIMNDSNNWYIENKLFKHFKLKEDSENFSEIYVTGYEEYYLENRELLKKANIEEWIAKIIKPKESKLPLNFFEMKSEEIHQFYEDMFQADKEITYITIGFIYLKYQLDIPVNIKKEIINSINIEIKNTKNAKGKYKDDFSPYYDKHIEHLIFFKNCIKKEDGDGLTNIGSILPKRSLYE
jgi:hypothetical protein